MGRRRGGCVLMALGIVLALVGGGIAFWIVSNAVNQEPIVEIPKKSIFVASTTIPERTQLNPAFYAKADWPIDIIPPDAIFATAELTGAATLNGQFTTEQIRQGQPILSKQVVTGTLINYSTYPWPLGKVLVAVQFPRASELINAGVLKQGVTVDLILNLGGAGQSKDTQYVLGMQGLKIFAIGQLNPLPPVVDKEGKTVPADPAAAKSTLFLFNVTPEDALTLKFIADLNPDFWVRSPQEPDSNQFNVPVVNGAYIQTRFRLPSVPGAPVTPGAPGTTGVPPGVQPGGNPPGAQRNPAPG